MYVDCRCISTCLIAITCNMNKPMSKCTLHLVCHRICAQKSSVGTFFGIQHTSILLFMILFLVRLFSLSLFLSSFVLLSLLFCCLYSVAYTEGREWVSRSFGGGGVYWYYNMCMQKHRFVASRLICMFFRKLLMLSALCVEMFFFSPLHSQKTEYRVFCKCAMFQKNTLTK